MDLQPCLHRWHFKIERVRAKKLHFWRILGIMVKRIGFSALTRSVLKFHQNKKNWNSNLQYLEQLLLKTFSLRWTSFFYFFLVKMKNLQDYFRGQILNLRIFSFTYIFDIHCTTRICIELFENVKRGKYWTA